MVAASIGEREGTDEKTRTVEKCTPGLFG